MSCAPSYRHGFVAWVVALAATACAPEPSPGIDDDIFAFMVDPNRPRMVEGRTYSTQPVEGNVGPRRFMFPANLYYNQIGPFPDGGVVLTVLWPGLEAAAPGDFPLRTAEDGYRQVSIELRYVGYARTGDYLAPHIGSGWAQSLAERVAQPSRFGLTPYAIANEALALDPDWYVVRGGDGRVRTFISCDPAKSVADGLQMAPRTLVRSGGDRIAVCRHSMVDVESGIAVEMNYARVLLVEWQRLEAAAVGLMRRYEAREYHPCSAEPSIAAVDDSLSHAERHSILGRMVCDRHLRGSRPQPHREV